VEEVLHRQLAAIVGTAGVGPGSLLQPADLTQLRELLASCAAAGVTVAPVGSALSDSADVVLGADRLDAVLLDPTSLLLHAGAAATWAAVRETAAARRFAVSGLPRIRSDRVGESVAMGEIAHRTLAGLSLVTAAGELISAGGRTLKDVVGYDLGGLALGSGERLGLIVAVTLRLDPAGARTPAEGGPGHWRGDAGLDIAAAFATRAGRGQATSPASD